MHQKLIRELKFTSSRSSGPGGQHVNKTESRVTLHWNLESSEALTPEVKDLLRIRLKSRLTADGELLLSSEASRSQQKNKEDVSERFIKLIEEYSKPRKKRIKTQASRASIEKRLKDKKAKSEKKRDRGRPDQD